MNPFGTPEFPDAPSLQSASLPRKQHLLALPEEKDALPPSTVAPPPRAPIVPKNKNMSSSYQTYSVSSSQSNRGDPQIQSYTVRKNQENDAEPNIIAQVQYHEPGSHHTKVITMDQDDIMALAQGQNQLLAQELERTGHMVNGMPEIQFDDSSPFVNNRFDDFFGDDDDTPAMMDELWSTSGLEPSRKHGHLLHGAVDKHHNVHPQAHHPEPIFIGQKHHKKHNSHPLQLHRYPNGHEYMGPEYRPGRHTSLRYHFPSHDHYYPQPHAYMQHANRHFLNPHHQYHEFLMTPQGRVHEVPPSIPDGPIAPEHHTPHKHHRPHPPYGPLALHRPHPMYGPRPGHGLLPNMPDVPHVPLGDAHLLLTDKQGHPVASYRIHQPDNGGPTEITDTTSVLIPKNQPSPDVYTQPQQKNKQYMDQEQTDLTGTPPMGDPPLGTVGIFGALLALGTQFYLWGHVFARTFKRPDSQIAQEQQPSVLRTTTQQQPELRIPATIPEEQSSSVAGSQESYQGQVYRLD